MESAPVTRPHAATWKQFSSAQDKRTRKHVSALKRARDELEHIADDIEDILDRLDAAIEANHPLPLIAPIPGSPDNDMAAQWNAP
jgi:hypothetical protein